MIPESVPLFRMVIESPRNTGLYKGLLFGCIFFKQYQILSLPYPVIFVFKNICIYISKALCQKGKTCQVPQTLLTECQNKNLLWTNWGCWKLLSTVQVCSVPFRWAARDGWLHAQVSQWWGADVKPWWIRESASTLVCPVTFPPTGEHEMK